MASAQMLATKPASVEQHEDGLGKIIVSQARSTTVKCEPRGSLAGANQ